MVTAEILEILMTPGSDLSPAIQLVEELNVELEDLSSQLDEDQDHSRQLVVRKKIIERAECVRLLTWASLGISNAQVARARAVQRKTNSLGM